MEEIFIMLLDSISLQLFRFDTDWAKLIEQGLTLTEIADRLKLKPKLVAYYLQNAEQKVSMNKFASDFLKC
jgi:orotate phosphoribosyltransferase-like protein